MGVSIITHVVVADYTRYPLATSVKEGVKTTYDTTIAMVVGLYGLVRDLFVSHAVPQGVAGPIGIGEIVG